MASPSLRPGIEEWAVVAALLLMGLAARGWQFSALGLGHFDEGVYAFSALGASDPSQPLRWFPSQINFSPPVYYSLVGLCFTVIGHASDLAAIGVNVALGTVAILLVWWVARAWFGRTPGVIAAAFVSFSEFHIALSRTALTDVAFALFFLMALALIAAALRSQRVALSLLAGLAVGLAWNTKYHGWFALMIGAGAALVVQWRPGFPRTAWWRPLLLLGLTGVVAAACYLPWALFVQSQPGGYAALADYQRTMIDPHWFQNFVRQAQMQHYFEGPLSRCAPAAAVLAAGLMTGALFQGSRRFLAVLLGSAISGLLFGSAGTAVLLTLAAIPRLIIRHDYPGWILLGWLGLWFVATPIYHPYARLLLPFTIATHIGAGVWLASVLREPAAVARRSSAWAFVGLAVVACVFFVSRARTDHDLWRPSRSVAEAAAAMASTIPPGERVAVFGEPALAFYLHLAGRPSFDRPWRPEDVAQLTSPIYVVTGVYAKRVPRTREGLKALGDQLVPVASYRIRPNDVRLLDDLRPQQAREYLAHPDDTFDLTLFRFVPRPAAQR